MEAGRVGEEIRRRHRRRRPRQSIRQLSSQHSAARERGWRCNVPGFMVSIIEWGYFGWGCNNDRLWLRRIPSLDLTKAGLTLASLSDCWGVWCEFDVKIWRLQHRLLINLSGDGCYWCPNYNVRSRRHGRNTVVLVLLLANTIYRRLRRACFIFS